MRVAKWQIKRPPLRFAQQHQPPQPSCEAKLSAPTETIQNAKVKLKHQSLSRKGRAQGSSQKWSVSHYSKAPTFPNQKAKWGITAEKPINRPSPIPESPRLLFYAHRCHFKSSPRPLHSSFRCLMHITVSDRKDVPS